MGNLASVISSVSESAVNSVYRGKKRKCIEEDDLDSEYSSSDETLQTPKRRKLLCTAQYIYKTLFLEGKGSDVTVMMLGRAWKLHKVYISQSPYFGSMFSGSWKEANEKVVNVHITDPNITHESLSVVLGSLYHDEVSIGPNDVISILATATLFQLQGLIDECTTTMAETINKKTVVPYFNAAISYGVPIVKNACKKWLEVNLVGYCCLFPSFLKEISVDLMTELVASSNLLAFQTEYCIYMMLRAWLFAHLQSRNKTLTMEVDEFFKNPTWKEPFLQNEGVEFSSPFKALRLKYLILHNQDVKILENDNLIPDTWLHEAYKEQWKHLLNIDAHKDTGPKTMILEDFSRECFRCARSVETSEEYVWRWTPFHFGLDLIVILDSTSLRFRRFHKQDDHIRANHSKHNIITRVCLISLNEQRQVKYIQDSGLVSLSFHKNEEKQVMCLDKELTYPLYISVNLQIVTPFSKSSKDYGSEPNVVDVTNL